MLSGYVILSLFGYYLLLKIENWKHCSKIIFKCVNCAVRPSFKEKVAEYGICGSCEQCTGPTGKNASQMEAKSSYLFSPTKYLKFNGPSVFFFFFVGLLTNKLIVLTNFCHCVEVFHLAKFCILMWDVMILIHSTKVVLFLVF